MVCFSLEKKTVISCQQHAHAATSVFQTRFRAVGVILLDVPSLVPAPLIMFCFRACDRFESEDTNIKNGYHTCQNPTLLVLPPYIYIGRWSLVRMSTCSFEARGGITSA